MYPSHEQLIFLFNSYIRVLKNCFPNKQYNVTSYYSNEIHVTAFSMPNTYQFNITNTIRNS